MQLKHQAPPCPQQGAPPAKPSRSSPRVSPRSQPSPDTSPAESPKGGRSRADRGKSRRHARASDDRVAQVSYFVCVSYRGRVSQLPRVAYVRPI